MALAQVRQQEITIAAMLDVVNLTKLTQWIRDKLDLSIARDGPEAILVEDALYMDQLLRKLQVVTLSVDDIRISRIHLALMEISGRATRWPHCLAGRAEAVIKAWECRIGKLSDIGIELLGPGGRLEGLATAADIAGDKLLTKWLRQGDKISPMRARKHGDLNFTPGQWWINNLFALRDGIIDSADGDSSITSDAHGAYAIVLANNDEVKSSSASSFTYRAHTRDKGRFRLTAATREARQPIRILRSHTLHSFWAPRTGVRYEGLYHVVGWSINQDPKTHTVMYDIHFSRLTSEAQIDTVLLVPSKAETEDYMEFKRLRQLANSPIKTPKLAKMGIPSFMITSDGAEDQSPTSTRPMLTDQSLAPKETTPPSSTKRCDSAHI